MAVSTDPQVLGDAHRVAGPRTQQHKSYGQLLAVI
uniref:Uncharacterized protein n=1 Tax=Arundo donax TaxID=35708 RepID=A0A0A8Z3Y5_ARUDO